MSQKTQRCINKTNPTVAAALQAQHKERTHTHKATEQNGMVSASCCLIVVHSGPLSPSQSTLIQSEVYPAHSASLAHRPPHISHQKRPII